MKFIENLKLCANGIGAYRYYNEHKKWNPWICYFLAIKSIISNWISRLVCKIKGHKIIDRSSVSPDSGNMDHSCVRCGEYWSIPLY